jgi:ribosomal protein L32
MVPKHLTNKHLSAVRVAVIPECGETRVAHGG